MQLPQLIELMARVPADKLMEALEDLTRRFSIKRSVIEETPDYRLHMISRQYDHLLLAEVTGYRCSLSAVIDRLESKSKRLVSLSREYGWPLGTIYMGIAGTSPQSPIDSRLKQVDLLKLYK